MFEQKLRAPFLFLFVAGFFILLSFVLFPVQTVESQTIDLYFFYGEGCPHCTYAKPFIDKMEEKYPALNVHKFEVWHNQDNKDLFTEMISKYKLDSTGVPKFFIGGDSVSGFGGEATTGKKIEDLILFYLNEMIGQFSDIDASLYQEAIIYLAQQDVVKGYDNNTFKPYSPINRAEFLKIIIESVREKILSENPETEGFILCDPQGGNLEMALSFSDVMPDAWYATYVCVASYYGIVNGYSDGTFKPSHDVNYAEALKILSETYGYESGDDGRYWYDKYIKVAKDNGFYLNDGIKMNNSLSRDQMAEMIYRIVGM